MLEYWPLVTGTLTALFAGVGVTLILVDRWYRITVEFSDALVEAMMLKNAKEPWQGNIPNPAVWDQLQVSVLVRNGSRQQIRIERWELKGVPLKRDAKTEIGIDVPIDDKASATMTFLPDWTAWLQSLKSSGMRNPSFRASVIIDRRTRIYPMMSRTAIIKVKAETVTQNDAKASQNSSDGMTSDPSPPAE